MQYFYLWLLPSGFRRHFSKKMGTVVQAAADLFKHSINKKGKVLLYIKDFNIVSFPFPFLLSHKLHTM